MAERIGDDLGKDETDPTRIVHRHHQRLQPEGEADVGAAVDLVQRGRDAPHVLAEVEHPADGASAIVDELVVEEAEALDAVGEEVDHLALRVALRLQADEAEDHRQVIAHPVLQFAQALVEFGDPVLRGLLVVLGQDLHAEEVDELAVIVAKWLQGQTVDELLPVGLVVCDLHRDVAPVGDGAADRFLVVLAGVLALKEAAVAPDGLPRGIPRHVRECAVDID